MRVAIAGGGIVAVTPAYQLLLANPNWTILVLGEKADIGKHQSGHNSGFLHST